MIAALKRLQVKGIIQIRQRCMEGPKGRSEQRFWKRKCRCVTATERNFLHLSPPCIIHIHKKKEKVTNIRRLCSCDPQPSLCCVSHIDAHSAADWLGALQRQFYLSCPVPGCPVLYGTTYYLLWAVAHSITVWYCKDRLQTASWAISILNCSNWPNKQEVMWSCCLSQKKSTEKSFSMCSDV